MLMMAVHDLVYSVKTFLSTWPIPREVMFTYGNVGNTNTCTAAGFLGHGTALTSVLYNGSLAGYFLLAIGFGKTELSVRRQWEPLLHILPLLIGWSTAIAGIPMDLYNPIGWTCWIGQYPVGCGEGSYPCTRGKNIFELRWAFFHAFLWASFLFMAIALIIIYSKIFAIESKTLSSRLSDDNKLTLSRRFAAQAVLYVVSFFAAWIFTMIQWCISSASGDLYYPILVVTVILNPLQGFFNFLIYFRPRFIRLRKALKKQRVEIEEGLDSSPQVIRMAEVFSAKEEEGEEDTYEGVESEINRKTNDVPKEGNLGRQT